MNQLNINHAKYMKIAIEQAKKAEANAEVPIGAVLIENNGTILSKSPNRTIELSDPTAHAEILTIRAAGQKISNYRLLNTTLYVTIEPCLMCMGALIHARVSRVYITKGIITI